MKPGDLVRLREGVRFASASRLDYEHCARHAFHLSNADIGVVIKPYGSYVEVLMRGQVVIVSHSVIGVIDAVR